MVDRRKNDRMRKLAREHARDAKFAVFRAQDCAGDLAGEEGELARTLLLEVRNGLEAFDRATDPDGPADAPPSRLRRVRKRWRWSVHTSSRPGSIDDASGNAAEPDAMHAIEAVAREHGCHGAALQFHYWPSGGWATFANDRRDTVTVLVVEAGG